MQKPAICPREEIDSNNFRGKIRRARDTCGEIARSKDRVWFIDLSVTRARTVNHRLTTRKSVENDLISHVIYLRCGLVTSLPSFSSLSLFLFRGTRSKRERSKFRYQAKISRSRSIGVTRACYRVEENLKDTLSRIPVTHCYQIIRQTRWSWGLIYLARHFQRAVLLWRIDYKLLRRGHKFFIYSD